MMSLRRMVDQIDQLSFYHVEMVQLENARSLEDQNLDYLGKMHKLFVFFVVTNDLKQNLSKKEPILMSLSLPNQETLVPQ